MLGNNLGFLFLNEIVFHLLDWMLVQGRPYQKTLKVFKGNPTVFFNEGYHFQLALTYKFI